MIKWGFQRASITACKSVLISIFMDENDEGYLVSMYSIDIRIAKYLHNSSACAWNKSSATTCSKFPI